MKFAAKHPADGFPVSSGLIAGSAPGIAFWSMTCQFSNTSPDTSINGTPVAATSYP
jgi:hypothetical protein